MTIISHRSARQIFRKTGYLRNGYRHCWMRHLFKRDVTGKPWSSACPIIGVHFSKLHAACTSERTGVSFAPSGGERHDTTGFEAVWEGVPGGLGVMAAVMDKVYDSHAIRRFLAMQGIEAVIPPRANRTGTMHYDPEKYPL